MKIVGNKEKTHFSVSFTMERVSGIEPPYPPWQGGVLPLNYTRNNGGSDEIRTRDLLRDRETR